MEQKKERLQSIAMIRAFSITFVVAFHAYGMMYANHFPNLKEIYDSTYYAINQFYLINIAMPMFVFVSGYLFAFLIARNKYPTFGYLVKNKVKRILLPYFLFGIVMMASTNKFHPLELLNGGYWHLWFLPMIFWCFLLTYLLHKLPFPTTSKWELVILFACFGIALAGKFLPGILGLHNLSVWYCWFYLGWVLYHYKDLIIKAITRYRLIYLLFVIYFSITLIKPTEYGDLHWYSELSQTSIIIALWYIAELVDWNRYRFIKPVISFSNYSYGIYIFYNWIQLYLISKTAQQLLPLEKWAAGNIYLFPFLFFLTSLFISYILTRLTLKTRIGKFLIG